LFYLEHAILAGGDSRPPISRQMQFVEIPRPESSAARSPSPKMGEGSFSISPAGSAPFLDYEPLKDEHREFIDTRVNEANWLSGDLESKIVSSMRCSIWFRITSAM
jgi:hypothetical protein